MKLFDFERRWMLRIFDAVLPSGADPRLDVGASGVPLGRFVDDLLRRAPAHFGLGLRAATWAVTLLGPLLCGRLRTFGGLAPDDRARVLGRLGASRLYLLREMPMLLKMVACLGWGGVPDVQRRIGLSTVDPTPPDWAREPEP